jgi:hypothetical protein
MVQVWYLCLETSSRHHIKQPYIYFIKCISSECQQEKDMYENPIPTFGLHLSCHLHEEYRVTMIAKFQLLGIRGQNPTKVTDAN